MFPFRVTLHLFVYFWLACFFLIQLFRLLLVAINCCFLRTHSKKVFPMKKSKNCGTSCYRVNWVQINWMWNRFSFLITLPTRFLLFNQLPSHFLQYIFTIWFLNSAIRTSQRKPCRSLSFRFHCNFFSFYLKLFIKLQSKPADFSDTFGHSILGFSFFWFPFSGFLLLILPFE